MADDQDKRRTDDEGPDEFGTDQKRMPFTHHLVELRFRIIVCVATVGVAFLAIFFVLDQELFWLMTVPLARACKSKTLIAKGVTFDGLMISHEPIGMLTTVAFFSLLAALALTMPVVVYQVWAFVAPGLKLRERKAAVPIMLVGTGLFLTGATFAYLVVLPAAVQFLLEYTAKFAGVKPLWTISKVIKFETIMMLVFGLAFELPLVVAALTRVGILSPEILAKRRRHAIVLMFVIGALLTPPDPFTQICLAVPLVILLEISIQASKLFRPKRMLWEAWDESELADTWDDGAGRMGSEPQPATAPAEHDEPAQHDEHGEEDYYGEYNPEDYDETHEDQMMGYDEDWTEEGEPTDEPEEPDEGEPAEDEEPKGDATPDGSQPDEAGGKDSTPPDKPTP